MSIELLEECAQYTNDPLGFVLWAFPWGEPGSELENETGPEQWQAEILDELGKGVTTLDQALRIARCSGHGIGKSALVSWVILWAIATFEDTKGIVTANTETQLKTKTWAELSRWFSRFIAKDCFDFTATRIAIRSREAEDQGRWKIDMVPWNEKNPEAFAGLHNKGKRLLLIMDEASGIPDIIWEVAEGALTDSNTQIIWLVFGNPTKSSGKFRQCFPGGEAYHRWRGKAIDSRSVRFTNKKQIAEWLEDYNEDSDFFRVKVRGVFPRVDSESFISFEAAREASVRDIDYTGDAIVLGVDVGRFGDDPSVIYPRKGRDARTHMPRFFYGVDTMTLVSHIVKCYNELAASIVFVDEGGVGGGVVDRLRQLKVPVMGIDFSRKSDNFDPNDGTRYANKRAEIWGSMRLWLATGAIVDKVPGVERGICEELSGPMFGMNSKEEILLESKRDMRKLRNIKSTNAGDALALTFAYDVTPVHTREQEPVTITPDYNPYSAERIQQWAS
jgi:hypothetical protein